MEQRIGWYMLTAIAIGVVVKKIFDLQNFEFRPKKSATLQEMSEINIFLNPTFSGQKDGLKANKHLSYVNIR